MGHPMYRWIDAWATRPGQGYRFVDIHEADDSSMRVLHVERVETHSPESLFARNAELYRVAETFGLDSYDGMDVGPATNY
jgi:Protein of unknown function (DUF1260).